MPPKSDLFPVHLLKNYVPKGLFEIVGHHKAAVEKKNAAGQMIVVEPARFVEGEQRPAPYPGAGFSDKIWSGTVLRLPIDEAKALIGKRLAERADELPA